MSNEYKEQVLEILNNYNEEMKKKHREIVYGKNSFKCIQAWKAQNYIICGRIDAIGEVKKLIEKL